MISMLLIKPLLEATQFRQRPPRQTLPTREPVRSRRREQQGPEVPAACQRVGRPPPLQPSLQAVPLGLRDRRRGWPPPPFKPVLLLLR